MEARVLALSFILLVNLCTSLKLPIGFKKCDIRDINFNYCLSYAIQDAVKQLNKPFPEYGLPRLDPFTLPVNLETGNSTDGIRRVYSNIGLKGFTKIIDTDARFDSDLNILSLKLTFPEILAESDIRVDGNFIILPVCKSGTFTFLLKKPTFILTFFLEKYEKNGIYYYTVKKTDFDVQLEKAIFDLRGIFDDKNLSDAFNAELNSRREEVFEDLKTAYLNNFGQVYGALFNNLLEKVPIADLFDGIYTWMYVQYLR